MKHTIAVGIDLGTSNCVIAYGQICEGQEVAFEPSVLPILQASGPGLVTERPLLPSALYLVPEEEKGDENFRLPWGDGGGEYVVGIYARDRGASVPDRLVTSAKSWLCSRHVERKSAVLPWVAEEGVRKFSPYEVTRIYLAHLKEAWLLHSLGSRGGRNDPLASCELVVTVPASFDEVARSLTHQAATEAGLRQVTLLEEPQAAFYDWLATAGKGWNKVVTPGDVILVCDVGGGTSDFTLIAVLEGEDGGLELSRVNVGEHLLLGGDNMDLALAYAARVNLEQEGAAVDGWQLNALVHLMRDAKELLLAEEGPDEVPISVPPRGSNLFAAPLSYTVTRAMVRELVLDGFFPLVDQTDSPVERRGAGLKELGLSYAHDPAITKHLAKFLAQSLARVKVDPNLASLVAREERGILRPTAVLFNGGVFNGSAIRERVRGLLESWNGGVPLKELVGTDRDLAVARGAAVYAAKKASGEGFRIRSGTMRSYYIGLESSAPAIPGFVPPVKGLCVAPKGLEEGSHLVLRDAEFGLVTGEVAEFRFFSSPDRPEDRAGQVVPNANAELQESAKLELELPPLEGEAVGGELVPVELHVDMNELGLLELWMKHTASEAKWKLEFNVRNAEA